ncbi:MAG: Crp/Fnr family transcriptional regulator [Anaerolineales bacterium]
MVTQHSISFTDVPLFEGVSADTLAPLQAASRTVHLEKGDYLFKQGDKGRNMYVIASGELRIWKENGHVVELARLGPKNVVGEMELIDGKQREAHVQALQPTELLAISREDFFHHLGNYPGMATHMMVLLSQRVRDNNARQMAFHERYALPPRLAALLLLSGGNNHEISEFSAKRAHMALSLATELEYLDKLLEDWQTQGVLARQDDVLRILDPAALETLAR